MICCNADAVLEEAGLPDSGALSTALTPKFSASYYKRQADLYFNSLESKFHFFRPTYSELLARWEWPPWLLLTGHTKILTKSADALIRLYPCICVDREHRFYETQPFARSIVTFYYGDDVKTKKDPIYIYEEFVFNDQGEITFIEAWSRAAGPQLGALGDDGWPSGEFYRLSAHVPGLGNAFGSIFPYGEAMKEAAEKDPHVKDFMQRTHHFLLSVGVEVLEDFVNSIMDKRRELHGDQVMGKKLRLKSKKPKNTTNSTAATGTDDVSSEQQVSADVTGAVDATSI